MVEEKVRAYGSSTIGEPGRLGLAKSRSILAAASSVFYGVSLSDSDGERKPRPRRKPGDRFTEDCWECLGKVETVELHKYFDGLVSFSPSYSVHA